MFDDDFDWNEEELKKLEDNAATTNNKNNGHIMSGPSTSLSNCYSHKDVVRTSIENHTSPKRVLVKRKFPGPAGLFPESSRVYNDKNTVETSLLSSQLLCTQTSDLIFDKVIWQDMCRDFKESSLLNTYNIKWIKNNVEHGLVNKKVPFLTAIVKQIKNTSKSPIFVLADSTGEIEALISTELYEDYNEYFVVGSVLVLKLFSLLTVTASKHYVNITSNNLIRIYSSKDLSNDYVKIVHLQEYSIENLENDINAFVNKCHQYRNNDQVRQRLRNDEEDMNRLKNTKFSNCDRNESYLKVNRNELNISVIQKNSFKTLQSNPDFAGHLQNTNDSTNSTAKKFKFRNVDPSRFTGVYKSTSIFDQSQDLTDLDLGLDDFKNEIMPQVNKNVSASMSSTSKNNSETTSSDLQSDQMRKVEHQTKLRNDDSRPEKNKIDCSQILIISQNKENPDIIKEVFSDLDASVFFDDF